LVVVWDKFWNDNYLMSSFGNIFDNRESSRGPHDVQAWFKQ